MSVVAFRPTPQPFPHRDVVAQAPLRPRETPVRGLLLGLDHRLAPHVQAIVRAACALADEAPLEAQADLGGAIKALGEAMQAGAIGELDAELAALDRFRARLAPYARPQASGGGGRD